MTECHHFETLVLFQSVLCVHDKERVESCLTPPLSHSPWLALCSHPFREAHQSICGNGDCSGSLCMGSSGETLWWGDALAGVKPGGPCTSSEALLPCPHVLGLHLQWCIRNTAHTHPHAHTALPQAATHTNKTQSQPLTHLSSILVAPTKMCSTLQRSHFLGPSRHDNCPVQCMLPVMLTSFVYFTLLPSMSSPGGVDVTIEERTRPQRVEVGHDSTAFGKARSLPQVSGTLQVFLPCPQGWQLPMGRVFCMVTV